MARGLENRSRIPVSTYRLQLNYDFTFLKARDIVAYLADLGITDLYTSSYLKASRRSVHGYDIVDFGQLNFEIGSREDYESLAAEQRKHGLGQIFDLVPNHMCITSSENLWWMDVLENGPSSIYARFFDINWSPVKSELKNKMLVPVLGDQYGRILENQELTLHFHEGAFFVSYWETRFPIMPDTYIRILSHRIKELEALLSPQDPQYIELLSINTALTHLPGYTDTNPDKMAERNREKEIAKRRLFGLYQTSPHVRRFIGENVSIFNGVKGEPKSFNLLDQLLQDQAYRLSYWRVATEEINYRRFFDINSLAAIRMEDPAVFDETHRLVFSLIREGKVTGLRVDHPDGLYDPSRYFRRLQRNCYIQSRMGMDERAGELNGDNATQKAVAEELERQYDALVSSEPDAKPFYIIGEKVLMRNEPMPDEWPIYSTTGYTFLNLVNGIFIDTGNEKAFDRIYKRFTHLTADYTHVAYEKKKLIMQRAMSSEINTLGHYLNRISEKNRHTRDFTLNSLTQVIVEIIAFFPVYRTYTNSWNIAERDRRHIEWAVATAKAMNPTINESIFDFLQDVLLLNCPPELNDDGRKEWLDFVMRFQQTTGPVMAKGLEDTAFYIYNRLISLNEVGGSPDHFGTSMEEFHEHNLKRQKYWPNALITTSTHDSKRGEDVRARINVLSEIPEEWRKRVTRWSQLNRRKRLVLDGRYVPDPNEEYFLYQTLIGAWPAGQVKEPDYANFTERIKDYLLKAIREAKVNTGWINPRKPYEDSFMKFIETIMSRRPRNEFLSDFEAFQRRIAYCGMFNSLSQTLLKIMSPGVPDFYQGTELWSLHLVDPDNRRPVDYNRRKKMLRELRRWEQEASLKEITAELLDNWEDGRIKMYVTYKALNFRRNYSSILEHTRYTPIEVTGQRAGQVCAFARKAGHNEIIVAVPRFLFRLTEDHSLTLKDGVWEDSFLLIPFLKDVLFENLFTGEMVQATIHEKKKRLYLADLFGSFPVALLRGIEEH
ncbi:MAG: Maltooligosyl trehalose synthase [Syntrophorhabdaceae bacterium PtaU1.Bin034]|nr:MAG: Maltooligosyl trehalose synthase [Syntrophorhabdaceae bacterium PtaU1.Bin034]